MFDYVPAYNCICISKYNTSCYKGKFYLRRLNSVYDF